MRFLMLAVSCIFFTSCSCMSQYDPEPSQQIARTESMLANQDVVKLNADGSLPTATEAMDPVMEKYQTFCASCHGKTGKGDGPGAVGMNARNFADATWKSTYGQDRDGIKTVIALGVTGAKEKDPKKYERLQNAAMVAWGAMLNEEELEKMTDIVQGFGS